MRLTITRLLAFFMLCASAAPAFAASDAAAAHAMGCDMYGEAAHPKDMMHSAPEGAAAGGTADKMRVCPLSGSCLPGLLGPVVAVSHPPSLGLAGDRPASDLAVSAQLRALDPPPPRLG